MLLDEPDGLIIDLLREHTEALCGHKPTDAMLERFLRSQAAEELAYGRRHISLASRAPVKAAVPAKIEEPEPVISGPSVRNRWKIGEKGGVERNGNDALTAF
jgi:hypothetical protein